MEKEIWINVAEHMKYKNGLTRMFETIFHEIGHAIFEESGVSYGTTEPLEEIIVDTFSKDMISIIKAFGPLINGKGK